jgi:hypothetical protein
VERTIAWLNRCRRLAKVGGISIATLSLSSNLLPYASCYGSYAIIDKVSGRTLSGLD